MSDVPALGELARLATAAMPAPPATSAWFTAQEFIADGYASDFAEFLAACSPAVILQLVALATGGAEDTARLDRILADGWVWLSGNGFSVGPIRSREELDATVEMLDAVLTPERPADATS